MSDVSVSPLFGWWKTLFGEMRYANEQVAQAVFDLFSTNHLYTPSFWSEQDEKGTTPLLWLALANHNTLGTIAKNVWKAEGVDLNAVCNTPSQGKVLLHALWKNSDASPNHPLLKNVELVATATDPIHWTWLDDATDNPGQGWVRAILARQKSTSSPHLENLLQMVLDKYPPVLETSPEKSPWLTVEAAAQVKSMLDSGYTLNDKIKIANFEAPAWLYLQLSQPGLKMQEEWLETLGEDRAAHASTFADKGKWQALSPNDRRAKIGFVKQILAEEGQDPFGRNSLMYLLQHRSDLIPLFHKETFRDKNMERFARPDKAGYSILTYCLFSRHLREIKACFANHDVSVPYGFEDGGWFAHERKSGRWFNMVARTGYGSSGLCSLGAVLSMYDTEKNAELLFGDRAQQKKWAQVWENFLPTLPGLEKHISSSSNHSRTGGLSPSQIRMMRQAVVYFERAPQLEEQLLPLLSAQLSLAGAWIRSVNQRDGNWAFRVDTPRNVSLLDVECPQVSSEGMADFARQGGVKRIFAMWYGQDKEQRIEQWENTIARNLLALHVESETQAKGANPHRRRM